MLNKIGRLLRLFGLVMVLCPLLAVADNLLVTRHFTGLWGQPDYESQGLAIQVVQQFDGSSVVVAYWYTYGMDRETAWFLGVGSINGDRVAMNLVDSKDVGFLQAASDDIEPTAVIGTMSIEFEDCNSGNVSFETDHVNVGSGSFRIERLVEIFNTHCSGGISDNMHADAHHGSQRIELLPARDGIMATGHARYSDFPGRTEFEVEIRGLPDGEYDLFSGITHRGSFSMQEGFGEMEYHSPGEEGSMLMTFDPRGMVIEIHDDAGLVMSSFDQMFTDDGRMFDYDEHGHAMDDEHDFTCNSGGGMGSGMGHGGSHGGGGGNGGSHGDNDCVDEGELVEIQVDLTNTGVIASASGDAEWEMSSHRVEFEVEIEGVPSGSYPVLVGGVTVGEIEASEIRGEISGHIRFRDPQMPGTELLDFDPRGTSVQITRESTVILEVEFPEG